ncbi:hypothetical protein QQ045_026133 [Rhodiola kirilowii]
MYGVLQEEDVVSIEVELCGAYSASTLDTNNGTRDYIPQPPVILAPIVEEQHLRVNVDWNVDELFGLLDDSDDVNVDNADEVVPDSQLARDGDQPFQRDTSREQRAENDSHTAPGGKVVRLTPFRDEHGQYSGEAARQVEEWMRIFQ